MDILVKLSGIGLVLGGIWSILYGLDWYYNKVTEKKARQIVGSESIFLNFKKLKKNHKKTGIYDIIGGIALILFGMYTILFL